MGKIFDVTSTLTNFEVQIYNNEHRFNGFYLRGYLIKRIKNVAYLINLDKYNKLDIHWIDILVKNDNATYFDSFGI